MMGFYSVLTCPDERPAGAVTCFALQLMPEGNSNPPRPPASIDDFRRIDPANVRHDALGAALILLVGAPGLEPGTR